MMNMQETWLNRLHEAQDRYKLACKRAETFILKSSSLDSDLPGLQSRVGTHTAAGKKNKSAIARTEITRPAASLMAIGSPVVIDEATGSLDAPNAGRKIRSCSSDAATTTTESIPIPRRISDPVCHQNEPTGSSRCLYMRDGNVVTTQAIISASPYASQLTLKEASLERTDTAEAQVSTSRRRGLFSRRQNTPPSFDDQSSISLPPQFQHESLETFAAASPKGIRRSRHTSLRVRRSLKSINERSLSTDTVYVRESFKKL